MKKTLAIAMALMALGTTPAFAAKVVTPDVPLSSNYYTYIDKLEAMGYIKAMPSSVRPYSRMYIAKLVATIDPTGMPAYMRGYYDELVAGLSDELAYLKDHGTLNKGQKDAQFKNNIGLKSMKAELSYHSQDRKDYRYGTSDNGSTYGAIPNASYQPLNGNNGGYRYGSGTNAVASVNISGNLNKDFAFSMTPRGSYDKDQKGTARFDDIYAKTHFGVWTVTVGKVPQNWGTVGGDEGISLSNNATANTMIKLGLIEPQSMKGAWWFKWLGTVDLNFFYSRLEKNRLSVYKNWRGVKGYTNAEKDNLHFIGMRADFQPTKNFTFGIERLAHLGKFGKNWLFIRDDGIDDWNAGDGGNDQAGIDFRWKFPGLQIYGGLHGEDGTTDIGTAFLCHKAARYGIYFPQLTRDGSWDLRFEYTKNDYFWYMHGAPDANGWTYHDDIVGDDMGPDADKYRAVVNKYFNNGDILGVTFQKTSWSKQHNGPKFTELAFNYDHKVSNKMHWNIGLGYAKIKNAGYVDGKTEHDKYLAAGVNWNF